MKWTLIPSKNVDFRTPLSVQEVFQRIQLRLTSADIGQTVPRFEGKITESDFELWEIVPPRSNSFLPHIKGTVMPDGEGALVRVVLRLNGCAFVFVLVWLYPFGLMLFMTTLGLFRGTLTIDWPSLAFILLMPTVMITITTLGFRRGVRSARAFLMETLGS